MCETCKMFFERIKTHLQKEHKLVPDTTQFNKMLKKNRDPMEDFIDQLYRFYDDGVDDDEQGEEDYEQEEEDQEPAPKKYEAESQFPEYKEKTRKHGKRKMEKFQRRPQKK